RGGGGGVWDWGHGRAPPLQSRLSRRATIRSLPPLTIAQPLCHRPGAFASRHPRSRELTHRFLKEAPSLVAVLALPFGVKAGRTKFVAERRRIGPIEDEALSGQILLQIGIELSDAVALFQTRGIDVLSDNRADIIGQALPGALIGEEPEAIPHVARQ